MVGMIAQILFGIDSLAEMVGYSIWCTTMYDADHLWQKRQFLWLCVKLVSPPSLYSCYVDLCSLRSTSFMPTFSATLQQTLPSLWVEYWENAPSRAPPTWTGNSSMNWRICSRIVFNNSLILRFCSNFHAGGVIHHSFTIINFSAALIHCVGTIGSASGCLVPFAHAQYCTHVVNVGCYSNKSTSIRIPKWPLRLLRRNYRRSSELR